MKIIIIIMIIIFFLKCLCTFLYICFNRKHTWTCQYFSFSFVGLVLWLRAATHQTQFIKTKIQDVYLHKKATTNCTL